MTDSISNQLKQAAKHLANHDPFLAPVIKSCGLADFKPHRQYYRALGDSIIGQQLSVKAASTIKQRFRDLYGGDFPSPEAILDKSVEELRAAGLSRAKATYIRDLAQHIIDGRVVFERLDQQSNQDIIDALTDIKGIGVWTVHMFLMFCMGRLNILAVGDLGIRNGIMKLYGLDRAPTPEQINEIAEKNNWHPYESVACWYIWRSLDNNPIVKVT